MLKTMGILVLISLTSNAFSNEYEVTLYDQLNGEVVVEKCINESELSDVINYAESLNDKLVKYSVKKLFPTGVMAIKKSGGEGGGD